jgi:acyl-ACP thioesterase
VKAKSEVVSVTEFWIYMNREQLGLAQLATEDLELLERETCLKKEAFVAVAAMK